MRYAIAQFDYEQEAVAFRLYIANAVNYGLGQPMTKQLGDILYPPEDIDVEALTKRILQNTGVILK
jgi:hypothetical protein